MGEVGPIGVLVTASAPLPCFSQDCGHLIITTAGFCVHEHYCTLTAINMTPVCGHVQKEGSSFHASETKLYFQRCIVILLQHLAADKFGER